MYQKRWYWCWRHTDILCFLLFYWTLTNHFVELKPLILNRDSSRQNDDWLPGSRTEDEGDEITLISSSEAITRINQLRKNMETFKQLRLMLNDKLLANAATKIDDDSTLDDSHDELNDDDENHRNFVLTATVDESGDTSDHRFILKRADDNPDNDQIKAPKIRHRIHRQEQQRRHRQKLRSLIRRQRKQDDERTIQKDAGASYRNHVQMNSNAQKSNLQTIDSNRQRQSDSRKVLANLKKNDNECPKVQGKATQVLCPSRRRHGYRVCIPDTALCNGYTDCPNGEDEDPVNCLFYKTTIHHFRLIVDAVVDLSDIVKRHEKKHMDEL